MTALRRSLCLALFLCASCLTFEASGQTYVRTNGQAIILLQGI